MFENLEKCSKIIKNVYEIQIFLLFQEVLSNSKNVCLEEKKFMNFKICSQISKNGYVFQKIYAISINIREFEKCSWFLKISLIKECSCFKKQSWFKKILMILKMFMNLRRSSLVPKMLDIFYKMFCN